MSRRFRTSTVAATLVAAAVVGFSGGAFVGAGSGAGQTAGETPGAAPSAAATTPTDTPAGAELPAPPATQAGLSATAAPTELAAGGRVDITGTLTPPQEGVTVSVQRLDGGQWVPFDASAPTRADGTYGLWLSSGRTGDQQFRTVVTDAGGGVLAASEPVTIRYR